jgi:crotonobetainyl-CoA:carnitine CoA-transferase CaiB-like acyl-CoA transferase
MSLPLDGIKVLDFTHLLPGELCSGVLTDLGAEVIRIEPITARLVQQLPPIVKGESLYYWSVHRNQRRLGLDLKNPRAKEAMLKLAKGSDVVIENFRPGVMSRLGAGYEDLSANNPGLVYCSISGYGQNSKWRNRPGHDLNFVAETGIVAHTSQDDGRPAIPGLLVSDYMTSNYAALSVVAALFERNRTGRGRHLDLSMFHCTLATYGTMATAFLYTGKELTEGNPRLRHQMANYNIFPCKDGRYLAIAPLEDSFWEKFCKLIDRSDLIAQQPLAPDPDMKQAISEVIITKTLTEWLNIFEGSDCCVSPVNSLEEALAFPPTKERNMILNLEHPTLGLVPQLRTPLPFNEEQCSALPAEADIALSTFDILKELGYSDAEIGKLSDDNVIPALSHI